MIYKKSKTRITVGIDKISDIEPLVKAGADEFFCGIVAKKQLNGRPNNVAFNLDGLGDLTEAAKTCHFYKKPIWLTLNFFQTLFTRRMIKEAKELFREAVQIGVDGIIIADVVFLSEISPISKKTRIAISTLLPKLNTQSIDFFKNFRFSRLIMERQMSVGEIKNIDKKIKHIELEVIVFPRCNYINAFCRYPIATGLPHEVRGKNNSVPCNVPLKLAIDHLDQRGQELVSRDLKKALFSSRELYTKDDFLTIFYLNKLKNKLILKIASRGNRLIEKVSFVKMLRDVLSYLYTKQPNCNTYLNWVWEYLGDRKL